MADNLTITQGSGTTIGADEISGVKYQRVKIIHGADGSNDGDVSSSNPLPVTVSGTVTTQANNLDIRDLTASDVVTVTGGVGQTADVKVTLDNESVAVTNEGLTELASAINNNKLDINLKTSEVSIGGSTQYTEGDTDTTITGTAMLYENSDTLVVPSSVSPLPVKLYDQSTLSVDATASGDVPITLDGEEVTVNLGATDNAVLDTIATNTGNALTDTQLRATAVPVSGTVTATAHTLGGATPYKLNSAASTNATSLKASAGQIYSIMATNTNAAVRYLKLYNKASAPTVGTDTPIQVYALPGATTGGGFALSIPVGMEFTTGIAFALTTGAADSDTGAVAANEIIVNITYK